MDSAVGLVEAYLRTNGYFTVTEYPILKPLPRGGYREATDLDVLAFRFGGASGRPSFEEHPGRGEPPQRSFDPRLGIKPGESDMIIAEVKEGNAEINPGAWDRGVMREALTRFGCCAPQDVHKVVTDLLEEGVSRTTHGHTIRIIAFGSWLGERRDPHRYSVILLQDVIDYLRAHLRRHWDAFGSAHLQEPALGFLQLIEKAERGLNRRA